MTPAVSFELQHVQGKHSVAIARLEERDKARDVSIQRIDKNVTWTLRGLVVVLLTVIGELIFKR